MPQLVDPSGAPIPSAQPKKIVVSADLKKVIDRYSVMSGGRRRAFREGLTCAATILADSGAKSGGAGVAGLASLTLTFADAIAQFAGMLERVKA